MIGDDEPSRDLAALVVPQAGRLVTRQMEYAQLAEPVRFRAEWEGEASLRPGCHDVAGLTPLAAEAFLAARRAAGYGMWLSPKALAPLLGYLRRLGAVPLPMTVPVTPVGALLGRYQRYLVTEPGLVATTARG